MKRRREFGPKREKNRSALIKFILLALLVAVGGSGLAYLAHSQIEPVPATSAPDPLDPCAPVSGNSEENGPKVSFFQYLFVFILMATIMAVLGLLFFGVRAYLTGTKVRYSLAHSRGKIKR
jgi:hypothetical protein